MRRVVETMVGVVVGGLLVGGLAVAEDAGVAGQQVCGVFAVPSAPPPWSTVVVGNQPDPLVVEQVDGMMYAKIPPGFRVVGTASQIMQTVAWSEVPRYDTAEDAAKGYKRGSIEIPAAVFVLACR